ncbi:hypothetical protein [Aquipseudomonas campi]
MSAIHLRGPDQRIAYFLRLQAPTGYVLNRSAYFLPNIRASEDEKELGLAAGKLGAAPRGLFFQACSTEILLALYYLYARFTPCQRAQLEGFAGWHIVRKDV